jgi:bifunctional DNA-binding transcriptional regulator/antitoxin component of YhaV-PrlF toxin-antitoxin module
LARIVSVTFETASHSRPGRFTIPRRVAQFLGIEDGDPIELAVTCEGFKVELETTLASGLEVRSSDPSTSALERIPANAPLIVTVWHPGEADVAPSAKRVWDRASFVEALVESGVERLDAEVVLDACLGWADRNGLYARWGSANTGSLLMRLDDDRIPSHGQKQRFFALWTTGGVELQFAHMAPPFDTSEAREELRHRLDSIEGITVPRSIGYPSFPLQLLSDDARREAVFKVFDWTLAHTRRWLDES